MISDDWIAGFVDGEGCFAIGLQLYTDSKPRKTATKSKLKKHSLGFQVVPSFRINVRHDDQAVLEQIQQRLGVGKIYSQSRPSYARGEQTANFYVVGLENLDVVRQFFTNTPLNSKKRHDFELWCQCLDKILQKRHLTKEGLLEICQIRDAMNRRESKGNRTTEKIKEILESGREHIAAHAEPPMFST
ncbi:MAG: LAGLIDADG family homing endonuclease [Candidatus Micrarchaeota archaeon]